MDAEGTEVKSYENASVLGALCGGAVNSATWLERTEQIRRAASASKNMIVLGALIVAAALWWAAEQIAGEMRAAREEAARGRVLALVELFAPALRDAQSDPRALLVWQPLAKMARQLWPDDCAAIDRAAGAPFPFTAEQVQAAHAQWTADWLAWERTHDGEYKLKAAMVEQELAASGGSPVLRGKLDAVEREKLDSYQRRYSEYVRIAKALQAL